MELLVGGGNPNWALAGVGAGLIVVGIPFNSGANKNARKAVEVYNEGLNSTSFYEFKPEFNIIASENGIGISMNF